MIFKGIGCYIEFVGVWDDVFSACSNCSVIQNQTISGIASMVIRDGVWEIELGQ